MMKRLSIAAAVLMTLSGAASADDRRESVREYAKARAEAIREYEKDRAEALREYEKDRREAEREYLKDRREAMREAEKDRREAEREWARGQYLPRAYLADRYYIRDYGRYDLAPPPAGHAYVRPYPQDDRYYLVQIATGLIARILGR